MRAREKICRFFGAIFTFIAYLPHANHKKIRFYIGEIQRNVSHRQTSTILLQSLQIVIRYCKLYCAYEERIFSKYSCRKNGAWHRLRRFIVCLLFFHRAPCTAGEIWLEVPKKTKYARTKTARTTQARKTQTARSGARILYRRAQAQNKARLHRAQANPFQINKNRRVRFIRTRRLVFR